MAHDRALHHAALLPTREPRRLIEPDGQRSGQSETMPHDATCCSTCTAGW